MSGVLSPIIFTLVAKVVPLSSLKYTVAPGNPLIVAVALTVILLSPILRASYTCILISGILSRIYFTPPTSLTLLIMVIGSVNCGATISNRVSVLTEFMVVVALCPAAS